MAHRRALLLASSRELAKLFGAHHGRSKCFFGDNRREISIRVCRRGTLVAADRGQPNMSIIALVTARGGSKGIPGKNLKPLGGRPLIAWSIEAARQSSSVDRVLVSTDDPAIAAAARDAGAEVPFLRPEELARDDSSHISVVLHALDWLRDKERFTPDYLLLLQPTAPFRTAEDLDAAAALARARNVDAVVSVCEARSHPWLAKTVRADGTMEDFIPRTQTYERRQDFPPAYVLNGALYLNRPRSLRATGTLRPPGTLAHVMPIERSVDLDTLADWEMAELLIGRRKARYES
jgi:CMP-N-acetylneuraminic acid synthetase